MRFNLTRADQAFIAGIAIAAIAVLWLALVLFATGAHARDLGQWGNSDPEVKAWFQSLMMPDFPTTSCCGEAESYWCDDVYVRKGATYCKITDDRDDAPLRRSHVDVGTEIEIPPIKLGNYPGNPTGHTLVFLSPQTRLVYCFIQGGGT
jgi:hypothetical protein